jgi:hypothetical protein
MLKEIVELAPEPSPCRSIYAQHGMRRLPPNI